MPSYIQPHSVLYFDCDTTFEYYPSTTYNNLINNTLVISTDSNNNTIANNNITNAGIILSVNSNNNLTNNLIQSSSSNGISIYLSSNNILLNNNISSSQRHGIFIQTNSDNNTFVNNSFYSKANGGRGMYATGSEVNDNIFIIASFMVFTFSSSIISLSDS